MTRDDFRQQMDSFKKARESNPQLSYWKWKANKYAEGTDYVEDTYLPEVVVTPRGNYINQPFDQDAYNSAMLDAWGKQTRIGPEDVIDYLPIIGDAKGIYDIGKDFYDGNTKAGLIGLGLAALPNFIEKPLRKISKSAKNFITALSFDRKFDNNKVNQIATNFRNGNRYLNLDNDPTVYDLLLSDERANVNNNIENSLQEYVNYLTNPIVQERIINSGATEYIPEIDKFINKFYTKSNNKPFGDLDVRFEPANGNYTAAVPWDKSKGDIIFYDSYTASVANKNPKEFLKEVPKHEASHYIEREINPEDLETTYNRFLADYSNIKSFDDWFENAIKQNQLPEDILSPYTDFSKLSDIAKQSVKDKAKDYYNYITDPSEIHSYLGEITRSNFKNKGQLFPYKDYNELESASYDFNPAVYDILNLYKDKNRLFNTLKNNLWTFTPGIFAASLLYNNKEENKSNYN